MCDDKERLERDNALLLKIRDVVVQESECDKDCGCLVCSEIWEFDNRNRDKG